LETVLNLFNLDLLDRRALRALARIASLGLFLVLPSPTYAQSSSPFAIETNLGGVYAFTQPPAGFNPSIASAADLERYGYPPRPAAGEPAKAFATWTAIANPALNRVVPQLLQTNIYHGQAAGVSIQNAKKATSENWSGYAVVQKKPAFTSVSGAWIVPAVQQAFGTCSGGTDYSSEWVGIDGYNNSNLVQAGSDAFASCAGGTTTTTYYPWIEWLPNSEIEFLQGDGNPLPFAQDDYLIVVVSATGFSGGKSSNGALSFTDVTQNWQVSTTFTAGSLGGTFVVGQSAEWIVERPEIEVGGTLEFSTLANYIADPWFIASAKDLSNVVHLPGSAKQATAYALTMTDDNGVPISFVDLSGTQTLWFFDENSSL
jgi:hypothetical protein